MKSAWLSDAQRKGLQQWLNRPNGSCTFEDVVHKRRAVFEAVEGGGIVVKVR